MRMSIYLLRGEELLGPPLETSYHTGSFGSTATGSSAHHHATLRNVSNQSGSAESLSQKIHLEALWVVRDLTPSEFPCTVPLHLISQRWESGWAGTWVHIYILVHIVVNQQESTWDLTASFSCCFGGSFTVSRPYCLVTFTSFLSSRNLWRECHVVVMYVLWDLSTHICFI